MNNNIEILESEIRQIFASVVWTHKIQEKQADIYLKQFNRLEFWRILLSALTSSGIFAVVFLDEFCLKVCTAIVSAISLFITTYFKSYDLKSLQKQHKNSAIEWLELRENITSVLCDIRMNKYTDEQLIRKRDEISAKKLEISKRTRDAGDKAVEEASKSLKNRQDNTYTDEEIDSYLPAFARRNR